MAIDPPVKTKVTVDPDTGARVFNQSWSSEIKKKEPIQRKPVSRETFVTEPKKLVAKPVVKQVAKETAEINSGKRKFSEVIVPSPAKAVGMELKTKVDIKKRAPESIHKEKLKVKAKYAGEAFDKKVMEMYPNKTLEKATKKYYNVKNRQDRRGEREVEKDWQSRMGSGGNKPARKGNAGCSGGCG